jgi:hypothetical protein
MRHSKTSVRPRTLSQIKASVSAGGVAGRFIHICLAAATCQFALTRRDVRHNSCDRTESLQVRGDDIVGALCATRIDLGGNRVDQCSVRVESTQNSSFLELHVRLYAFQGILSNEERSLHSAVVAPEMYGAPCGIVRATSIWKGNRHSPMTVRFPSVSIRRRRRDQCASNSSRRRRRSHENSLPPTMIAL